MRADGTPFNPFGFLELFESGLFGLMCMLIVNSKSKLHLATEYDICVIHLNILVKLMNDPTPGNLTQSDTVISKIAATVNKFCT